MPQTNRRSLSLSSFKGEENTLVIPSTFSNDQLMDIDQMQAPKPNFNFNSNFTFISVYPPTSQPHVLSQTIKANNKTNAKSRVYIEVKPQKPLPTYPPEIYINSDTVEFGFKPLTTLPSIRKVTRTEINLKPAVIKSTLEHAFEENEQDEDYSERRDKKAKLNVEWDNLPSGQSTSNLTGVLATSALSTGSDLSSAKSLNAKTKVLEEIEPKRDFKKVLLQANGEHEIGVWKGLLESDLPPQLRRKKM